MKRSIFSAISLVLLSSLVTAQAQEAKPEETKTEEVKKDSKKNDETKKEVIRVTGSRIKQIDVETAVPVTTYSKEDIDRSGLATVSDFIRNRIPSGGMTTENETLNQSAGSASFGGRDFDPAYTLILVNGRRLPSNAIADDYVDLNLIPLAAVERIEYLTGGASAIYGSDAVAGVLNIITKTSFNGTSVVSRAGMAPKHKDGVETSLQVVSGASNEKSNFLISGDLFKREAVKAKNRPLINSSISPDGDDGRSPYGLPGWVERYNPADNSDVTLPFKDCPEEAKANDGTCSFDIAPLYEAIPKTERQSIYTIFDHQLTDSVKLFGEARFSRSSTSIRNGAAPGLITLTGTQWNAMPAAMKELSPFYDPNDPNKQEAADVEFYIGRRFLEFGPRATENLNESFNLVAGLSGDIFSDTNWELTVTKHQLKNLQFGVGGNVDSVKAAEAFSSGILNPFVLNTFDTPEALEAKQDIVTEIFRLGESNLQTYSLNFDGDLPFSLSGGNAAYSAGVEYRDESYIDQADSLSQEKSRIAGSAGGVGNGGQETKAAYLEVALPVIPKLDLKAAIRNDSISNTLGSANTKSASTYQASFSYAPIDMLKVRASYGTGFKAAPLHDRFLQISQGVERVIDPVFCANNNIPDAQCVAREVNSQTTGNSELDPEKTKYYNIGFVLQPIAPLSVSLDYWHLTIDDKIGSLTTQYLINNEAEYGDFIKRSPNGDLKLPGAYVESKLLNLTKNESSGVELGGSYTENLGFAKLTSGLKLSKVLVSKTQSTPTDPLCDSAKSTSSPNASWNIELLTQSYSAGAIVRYDSGGDSHAGGLNPGTCDFAKPNTNFRVKPYAELGMNVGYVATFGTEFGLGVQNVTDAQPAYDRNATWPWYSQQNYSNMGRFVYVSVGHKFE